jgi:DNA transformation protein
MTAEREFATHIVDLLDAFGHCEARRMFGGYGIFHHGQMFGLIADGSLYLKADNESRELFLAEGSSTFTYYKQERECKLSYYLTPDVFFEDSDACLRWAHIAFDAALRNPTKRKKAKA